MSRGKRVLFVSHVYPNGASRNTAVFHQLMVRSLAARCEVDVLAPIPWTRRRSGDSPPYEESLDRVRVVHPSYLYIPGALRFTHGYSYLLSIRRTVERLMRQRAYDAFWSSWLFPDGWAATRLARHYGKPCCLHVIGTDVNRLAKGTLVTAQSLAAIGRSASTLCVSRALRDKLVSLGANPSKLTVLYNGVDRTLFAPRDKAAARKTLGADPSRRIVLFVGNLIREKGVHELAQAVSMLCTRGGYGNLQLVMVGSGPCQQELESLFHPLVARRQLLFPGRLPHDLVAQWMNAADVFCLPSYSEGLPNVICEALCCHTPVVATRTGGIPELLEHTNLLALVEPRDSHALAAALENALEAGAHSARIPAFPSWEEHALELYRHLFPPLPGSPSMAEATPGQKSRQ